MSGLAHFYKYLRGPPYAAPDKAVVATIPEHTRDLFSNEQLLKTPNANNKNLQHYVV